MIEIPNYCDCELTVSGAKGRLEEFKQMVAGDEDVIDADKIIPYPRVLAFLDKRKQPEPGDEIKDDDAQLLLEAALAGYDTKRDGFNQGGYEWCVANWGTKWGFCHPSIDRETSRSIRYSFMTAWGPPEPLIKRMGQMFLDLKFKLRYYEGAMAFQGCLRLEGGQVIEDWSDSYHGDRGG